MMGLNALLARIGLLALAALSLFAQAVEPKVRFRIEPEYTEAARKAKIQGLVSLECTVGTDGLPKDIHVVRSLETGLDVNAVAALKRWIFWPATTVDGKPFEKKATVDFTFKLKTR